MPQIGKSDLSHNERCALRLAVLCGLHKKVVTSTSFKGRDADNIPYSILIKSLVQKGYLKAGKTWNVDF